MPTQLKQWLQREWKRANVDVYRDPGDFYALVRLEPTERGDALRRIPDWHAQVRHDTNGLHSVRGIFYDEANSRFVLLGNDTASGDLAASYFNSSWTLSSLTVLHTAPSNLGGLSLRDYAYYGGKLWLIGSDGKVYAGTSYTATLSEFDADTTHRIICPIDERVYVVHNTGQVDRTDDAGTALETYFTPDHPLDVRFMAGFRGYALLVVKDMGGALHLMRLPLNQVAPKLSLIASVHDRGSEPTYGCLFTMHEGDLYFSPGFFTTHGQKNAFNLYRFNGANVEHITRHAHAPNSGTSGYPTSAGLLSWQGKLLYYALAGTASQILLRLLNDTWVDHAQLAQRISGLAAPFMISAGNRLICTVYDGTDEGISYLEEYTFTTGNQLITPRLDMGYPDRLKRLARITVLVDNSEPFFYIRLEYRTDDNASWTFLGTHQNTRRASSDVTAAVEFYTLQLKIQMTDNTGTNPDYRIEAVSVTYAVDA